MSQNIQILVGRVIEVKGISGKLCEVTVVTDHWDSQKSDTIGTFHKVNIIGKGAEFASTLEKSDIVSVQGRTEHQEYKGKYYTKVIAFNIQRESKYNKTGVKAEVKPKDTQYNSSIQDDQIPF